MTDTIDAPPQRPQWLPDDLLTPDEAAEVVKLKASTLKKMRSRKYKNGPDYRKRLGKVLYRYADLVTWCAAHDQLSNPANG